MIVIEIKHQLKNILIKIRPYLKDIINNLKKSDTWKIQLTIANNFISSIDNDEERVMHSKSDNIEIMINDEADEVIKELFDSLKNRYQNNLESMKGSKFVFEYVQSLYYKYHKIHSNYGGLYIDSPDSIKSREATINPINKKDNKCFQYAVTVMLNHEEIRTYPEKITKIKPLINKYNWEGINFPSEKDNWKKIEKNNIIALNVLYVKKEKIYCAYVSKHDSNREKQGILLMISNREKIWHYAVVKKLSTLLRGITSKNKGHFFV